LRIFTPDPREIIGTGTMPGSWILFEWKAHNRVELLRQNLDRGFSVRDQQSI
jgi:hypothetical protein